jgi:N6-adenosine-specific RNA methylase IME4/ParB-like chromosome segregation protein Spo0J
MQVTATSDAFHRETSELKPHPHAARVPAPTRDEYRELRADVDRRSVVTPLAVTAELVVLDGHQRLRAAKELKLRQLPVRVVSPPDEVAFMLLAALRRRNLTASQRAMLAVELAEVEQAREEACRRRLANLRQNSEVATLPPRGERTRELAARTVGASPRTIQDALLVREADAALAEEVKAGRVAVDKAARGIRQARMRARLAAEQPAMPEGPFQLIYADPPWQLGGDPLSPHAPENHYPTLPLEVIKALAVPTADDAVLFLWVTCGLLPEGLDVMKAWGFRYRSQLVWVKPSPGLGHFVRYQHELLLVGLRGGFAAPEPELRPASVFAAKRGRHSEKPSETYELIERMYPQASKLELFARKARPGWAAFGNEVAP